MSQYEEHEMYLKRVLSNSISSQNPSEDTKRKARKLSSSYFQDYKQNLLKEYEGKKLTDITNSHVVSTSYGDTLKITEKEKIDFEIKDNDFKSQINSNLKLLPKIGLKTEQNLKNKGFTTIESLKNHDKYCDIASKFIDEIDEMSFGEIIDLLDNNKYSRKCRDNLLKSISLTDCENFKFMDIETLGLSNVPIILIGVAEIKGSKIISSQYFLRDIYEEPAVIEAYLSHLDGDSVHVTFNGKSFDVPFIKNRCLSNRMEGNLDLPHLDLMYFAKNLWRDELPNCQLQTIEKEVFGIEREGDVPGQHIPDYYNTYLSEKNIGPIVPIIEHNRQDIVSLASFLERMYEDVN
ncbi:ribonuclease H-like domain-containing protein [Methanobrevibacter sp.]|uniref:ribonuclease H-like domain-containing protein n=1 Tax=Methanobrevibacter sp. TaxID=66852 RepID=UPI0025D7E76C|nr:ribonuclease H-like domain-containing protein [Methanobrevibacter sp.]MBQ2832162.1 ribonuclease H-like domain-containing protein [Methanobrevibacter sp.]